MKQFLTRLKQEANDLYFNRLGVKAFGFLAKDAFFNLKQKYIQVFCLDLFASVLQAAVYLITLQALKTLENGQSIQLLSFNNSGTNVSYFIILAALVIFCLICCVELRYRSFSIVCAIWEKFTTRCAIEGAKKINSKANLEESISKDATDKNANLKLLRRTINRDAISAGFFAKQLAQILSYIIQALVFFMVLLYLNTTLTLFILMLSSLLIVFYFNSYLKVARSSNEKQELAQLSKQEVRHLNQKIESNTLTKDEITREISSLFSDGNLGKALDQKIHIRKSIKRGASIIEFANPLALLIIGIIAISTDHISIPVSTIIIYFLLLKQMTSLGVEIGNGLITINRVHPNITNYLIVIDQIEPNIESEANSQGSLKN